MPSVSERVLSEVKLGKAGVPDSVDVLERVTEGSPVAVALGWSEGVLLALPLVFPSKETLGGCVAVTP